VGDRRIRRVAAVVQPTRERELTDIDEACLLAI